MTRSVRLKVRGVSTAARVSGQGPPIVIVPGLGCASWMYGRLAHELSATHTVWRYDHPGHGWSGGRARDLPGLGDHLAAFLRAAGLSGAPLLGHSLGGELLLDLASRRPDLVSALIVAAPTGVPDRHPRMVQLWHLLQDAPRERPGLIPLALAAYLRCGARDLISLIDDMQDGTLPKLRRIGCPVLALRGGRDPIVPQAALTACRVYLREGRVQLLPGAAHALTDSHPAELAAQVRAFLDSLPPPG